MLVGESLVSKLTFDADGGPLHAAGPLCLIADHVTLHLQIAVS